MSDVSPIGFIFFVSIMLVPTGPYIWKETEYKKTGIAVTVAGICGTAGVGVAVFWQLIPVGLLELKISRFLIFIIISLSLAALASFIILRGREKPSFVAIRDVLLLLCTMWVVTRLILPMLGFQMSIPQQPLAASGTETAQTGDKGKAVSSPPIPASEIDRLQQQLAQANAQIVALQSQQRHPAITPAPIQSTGPIWGLNHLSIENGFSGFVLACILIIVVAVLLTIRSGPL